MFFSDCAPIAGPQIARRRGERPILGMRISSRKYFKYWIHVRKIGVNVNATGAADFGMGIVFRKELGKGKGLGEFNMDIELLFIVVCIYVLLN